MSTKARKAYFVDPAQTRQLKKLLKTKTEAEAIRRVVAEAIENKRFWNWLKKQSGTLQKTDIVLFTETSQKGPDARRPQRPNWSIL